MLLTWGPTLFGKLFTRAPDWKVTLEADDLQLQTEGKKYDGRIVALAKLRIEPGIFWATVTLSFNGHHFSLAGIPNRSAKEMAVEVGKQAIQPAKQWADKARAACKAQLATRGWLTQEFKNSLNSIKPQALPDLLAVPELVRHLNTQPQEVREAVAFWKQDFLAWADRKNEEHLAKELRASKAFLDKVEKSPLTEEQARAVICFDNRVLLVASAGSGKTSTMVAKAGYALSKGYFAAEQMLLLAFNRDAAAELRERVKVRLEPLGLPAEKIVAKTFHAFGLDVIGQATGKRPSLAPWLENGRDLETFLELMDDLKGRDRNFRTNWDLFRIVLSQDLPRFGMEMDSPDSWVSATKTAGFWTLSGETVKSRGEQIIANWLFYNGVKYKYEEPYRIETADVTHRQYRPDFYLPDIDCYLEHWALDQNGNPPPEFVGYRESMAWKKNLHACHETTLLETTMAQLWSGEALRYLALQLEERGIVLDPNPDRPVPGRKPIENPRLARTFRTFLTHAKSNRLTVAELRSRLDSGMAGNFRYRHGIFLNLFEQLWAAWEEKLQRDNCIDFEDMLGLAANCLEQGKWTSPYELVMVDEFQDASQARARLVAGLLQGSGKCLFAVGDDWQSINRFAGADLEVMTRFEARFGRAVILRLEQTYRCPQSLCDISSKFVQKNPKQIRKKVQSAKANVHEPVHIIEVKDEDQVCSAIRNRITETAAQYASDGQHISIYVIGRYNDERRFLPPQDDTPHVTVEFITAHSSKGLEADHVIVPKMTAETLGFPSRVADDPVLRLAMPGGDDFEDAEERRLFYVALTRARVSATLITIAHKQSSFIAELVKEHSLRVFTSDGLQAQSEVCPKCAQGFLKPRTGPYGPFLGCSRFPKCKYTRNIKTNEHTQAAVTES